MREFYNEKIKNIHASQELINTTLGKIHQEQNKIRKKNRIKNNIIKFSLPMVAAAIIIFSIQPQFEGEFVYNKMPNMSFVSQEKQVVMGEYYKEKIDVDEYENYIKVELAQLMTECNLKAKKIELKYQNDSMEIMDDEGLFTSIGEKSKISLRISKNKNLISQGINDFKTSKYCGKEILLAINEDENMIIAMGNGDNVSYYIKGTNIDKNEFEKKIKKILKYL